MNIYSVSLKNSQIKLQWDPCCFSISNTKPWARLIPKTMKLYCLYIFYLFIYSATFCDALQLNYSNITSLEDFVSLEQIAWTLLVPILCLGPSWQGHQPNKTHAKQKLQSSLQSPLKSLSDIVIQKHNHPHIQRRSTFRGKLPKLPYVQILHIFTELHFNTISYMKPEQN